ncbi:YitT family protein [Flaviaesturariibacter flavus]|uniref:YitT family protein n=1 Tax=Flaviaesturariibacter flavus TaxID=2502780 RepID=A0A4R1BBT4_9BACT|nr:YitT family protein [Flaviaesturariibacter flavus]TCJ14476.1 YitT family protein [Flaviaesturariibacter flavus]
MAGPHLYTIFNTMLQQDNSRSIAAVQRARARRKRARRWRSGVTDAFQVLLGVLSAGFGLKGFLLHNGFIDGGVTGISLLTTRATGFPLPLLIIAINLPFLLLGFQQIGRGFTLRSFGAIALLAIAVQVIPYPVVTNDKILVAVFGGFFLGAGIGLSIRGGSVIDGTEILAIHLNRRSNLSVGDFILVFNIIIFSVAAWLLSVETALYSILTYLAASKTVDFILEGIDEFTGVTIISVKSRQISTMIQNDLGRGLTIYQGKRGVGRSGEQANTTDIIFTVVTRLELNRLKQEVNAIDRNAFMVMHAVKDAHGGMIKRKPLKKI